jgi:hypothetical protein
MHELDRILRERTAQNAATRYYIWTDPKVDLNSPAGDFWGEAVVESEPQALAKESPEFIDAWTHPERKRIVMLDIAGTVLVLIGAGLLALRAALPTDSLVSGGASLIVYGILFAGLGSFALHAAHSIWSRFDFVSRALKLTMNGHYIANTLDVGAKDAVIKTKSKLVQTESMTFSSVGNASSHRDLRPQGAPLCDAYDGRIPVHYRFGTTVARVFGGTGCDCCTDFGNRSIAPDAT